MTRVPFYPPPREYRGTPCLDVIPGGSILWRIHHEKYPANAFRPVLPDTELNTSVFYGGGRFDSTMEDLYPYLYVAHKPSTAIAETFLRNLPFPNSGARLVRAAALRGRRLSAVELKTDISVLRLVSAKDLAAVHQDQWLVDAETDAEYVQTRHCGHWLRKIAPSAQGFVWQSKRDRPETAIVIFGDRYEPESVLCRRPSIKLDDEAGIERMKRELVPYGATVRRPTRRF